MNLMDYREALSYHLGEFYKKVIEDWNKALESKNPEKRETVYMNREELATLTVKNGYVHVTGLSSEVTEKDILGFFSNQKVHNKGIKPSVISGKPSDEAYIADADALSADQACKLSGEFLAGKMLKIAKKGKPSLEDFLNRNFISHNPFMSRENIPPIPQQRLPVPAGREAQTQRIRRVDISH